MDLRKFTLKDSFKKDLSNYGDLGGFFGSEHYYKGFLNTNLTDGVFYFLNKYASWSISDIEVILKMKLKNPEFCSIYLIVQESKALIVYTDGNENILYKQYYNYADLKDGILLFFYTNNVLMLASEY